MHESRNSWIDRRELEELLRQLMPDEAPILKSGDDPVSLLADPNWDEVQQKGHTFSSSRLIGGTDLATPLVEEEAPTASDEIRKQARESLSSILQFNSGAGIPEADSAEATFEIPTGTLNQRLRTFANWVSAVTGASQIHIADSQGYSLLDPDSSDDAVAVSSALQLANALEKVRNRMQTEEDQAGIHLPIDSNRWFGVIECKSSHGRVCLSLITPGPLSPTGTKELARLLWETLEG